MTYARARLWLGISGVGAVVAFSGLLLLLKAPRYLPENPLLGLGAAFWIYAAFSLPFDLLGGYLLPCRYGRLCQTLPAFLWAWWRGVSLQGITMVGAGLLLMTAHRWGGFPAVLLAALLIMLILLEMQVALSKLVGGLRESRRYREEAQQLLSASKAPTLPVTVLSGIDQGFSGGVVGLPGRDRIVAPASWLRGLAPESLAVELVRRSGAVATGTRARGVLVAILWNLAGLSLVQLLPEAGFSTTREFITTSLWFTQWSFLGLLLLPSLSRPGVLELDKYASRTMATDALLSRSITELDQLQDDEPSRPKLVETVFHPIPSVSTRLRSLSSDRNPTGAWHAARTALYLSWACFNFLPRAVHCNAGRPELWVLLPAD